jgi:hypothetical protein
MPNPNAIVGTIVRFEPPLDRPAAEVLRDSKRGLTIEFEDGRRARIDPDDRRAVGYAEILEDLRARGRPAYVDVDPRTGAIIRLQIPRVTHVLGLTPDPSGDLIIEILYSHGAHILRRASPDFAEWERLLRDALEQRLPVVLTEDESHNLIDLRWYPNPEEPLPLPRPGPPLEWWRRWPWRRFVDVFQPIRLLLQWWLSAVTQAKADQMFALVNATSCDPITVPPPCIPFLYPDDGCWARAHEMCRLMTNAGVTSRKVWIYGSSSLSLKVSTKNSPDCQVAWDWHVAPTLNVRGSFPIVQEQVIDPALFPGPVLTPTWQAKQTDPSSQLVGTDATVFYRSKGGTINYDPNYTNTNALLADYRGYLKTRAINDGPPPYANCP